MIKASRISYSLVSPNFQIAAPSHARGCYVLLALTCDDDQDFSAYQLNSEESIVELLIHARDAGHFGEIKKGDLQPLSRYSVRLNNHVNATKDGRTDQPISRALHERLLKYPNERGALIMIPDLRFNHEDDMAEYWMNKFNDAQLFFNKIEQGSRAGIKKGPRSLRLEIRGDCIR